MPTISTYQLTPHLPLNSNTTLLTTEFFRDMVNRLVRNNWEIFIKKGADPSLFFNHDLKTGKTRVGYPLVIYHFVNGHFYITGIDEGAIAVEILATRYKGPFGEGELLFPGIKKTESAEYEMKTQSGTRFKYRLINWVPFHYKDYKDYEDLPFAEKVNKLNRRLQKHLGADMAKYLKLDFDNLAIEISGINSINPVEVYYEGHKYYAYHIEFTANILFPNYLTLGNNKSLGFGRIETR